MRAIIFGAGKYSTYFKRGLEKRYGINIIAICDNDEFKWGGEIEGALIINPQQLLEMEFDKIFISVMRINNFISIENQLLEMGIEREKIVVLRMSAEYQDVFIESDSFRKNWMKHFADYSRELNLEGNVAECGVFCGDTAVFINKYWPNRTLYLFDTFEGFAEKDISNESRNFMAFKEGIFKDNPFKNNGTSEELIKIVESRMLYPKNIRVCKGYFPQSATNIKDKFCFVNLDMDLYEAQLEGLRFFWNKMETNGVILLHDYFRCDLPGVRAAVLDFEKEMKRILPKIPIGDGCSIAIIKCD